MSTRLWFTLDGISHHPSALPVQVTSQFITTMLATLLMKSAAKNEIAAQPISTGVRTAGPQGC
jgi:hypothetical protein